MLINHRNIVKQVLTPSLDSYNRNNKFLKIKIKIKIFSVFFKKLFDILFKDNGS